jgi:RNA polymerase sigma factor (sigma-70 family)
MTVLNHGLEEKPSNVRDRGPKVSASSLTRYRGVEWDRLCSRWRRLMMAGQRGDEKRYEILLVEIDGWLERYYRYRLSRSAAEDARQEALLAIHSSRHNYRADRPFGPWLFAIARYKWVNQLRDASRHAACQLDDESVFSDYSDDLPLTASLQSLLRSIKPEQARVIELVKLQGASIEEASRATGQSRSLVKVNIHRGLKKLSAFIAAREVKCDSSSASSAISKSLDEPRSCNQKTFHGISLIGGMQA